MRVSCVFIILIIAERQAQSRRTDGAGHKIINWKSDMEKQENTDRLDVDCSALFGPHIPSRRWWTFSETVKALAIHPKDSGIVWEGHKNNPRPSSGPFLSALEKVAPLRHLIRLAEIQKIRFYLCVARIYRLLRRPCDSM